MIKKYSFIVMILPLVLLHQRTFAQEKLTLAQAISLGLSRNYDIQIEQSNLEVAKNNNNYGEAGLYPSFSFDVNQNNTLTENVKTASPFAIQGTIRNHSLAPAINMNWVLFDGFRVHITKRRLEQMEAQSMGNVSIVIANTIQSIILGYYLAALEQQRLEVFKQQLQLSSDKYLYLETKSEIGAAVTSDLLLEEGNYLTDSVNYINQRLALRNAIRTLNVLLAEPNPSKEYVLTDTLAFEQVRYSYEAMRQKMLNSNVDLKTQYITQEILGSATKLARADRMPTLSLNLGASHTMGLNNMSRTSLGQNQRDSLSRNPNAVFVPDYLSNLQSTTNSYYGNFTLSFTLFNGGKINRAIQNAVVQEHIGEMQISQMQLSLERDLMSAFDTYEVRSQLYGINARRVEAAQINLEVSKEKYQNGSINSFDYRVVQNTYLTASISALQSLYDLMDSKVELMRLTGGIIETYQ